MSKGVFHSEVGVWLSSGLAWSKSAGGREGVSTHPTPECKPPAVDGKPYPYHARGYPYPRRSNP